MKSRQQSFCLLAVLVTASLVGLMFAQRMMADRTTRQTGKATRCLYAEHVEDDFCTTMEQWR